ncbi:Strongly to SAM-dependent methyltransferase YecO [Bacillus sp. M6-12]|nr:Strongly to SAM-dependent methyltransferase YecO [Bacillus sp. M6-12]
MYPLSQWSFNQEVSHVFDNHVRQSVPLYDSMQQVITQLSDFFVQPNTVIYDLGCATGETIFHINQRHKEKKATFIGIDDSESMLQKAIEKNHDHEHIHFVHQSIENYTFEQKSNLILSVLTIQFIPIEKREMVIRNIYNALNKGGAFLFVEKCYAEQSKIQDIFTQLYHDEKEIHGLTPQEIREKDKSLRGVLNSMTAVENNQLLQSSGFSTVEVFFKYLNFTGFLAIK